MKLYNVYWVKTIDGSELSKLIAGMSAVDEEIIATKLASTGFKLPKKKPEEFTVSSEEELDSGFLGTEITAATESEHRLFARWYDSDQVLNILQAEVVQ